MNKLELKKIIKESGLNRSDFAKELGISTETLNSWQYRGAAVPENMQKLINSVFIKNEYVKSTSNQKGTPYFDIDFTASFLEVDNTQQTKPDAYVTHPFFKNCDFIVRASGQSMAKIIKHGDAIGLVQVKQWNDFLPLGEVYAIVTKNNFRMIKVITKGDDKEHFTLISKPSFGKTDEFPPQQIKKDLILYIFKVQASSHLF